MVAGQGTLGIELLEQEPELDAVFIAVSGGGLIGGTGTVFKAVDSDAKVVGVWPAASPCMLRALQAGQIIPVEEHQTLSDGTAGALEPGSVRLPICQAVIDQTVEVSEAGIAMALRQLAEKEHLMVEGSAGVALAGLEVSRDWSCRSRNCLSVPNSCALARFFGRYQREHGMSDDACASEG